ncbi:MAG TPA: hypothetical protein VFK34_09735 [Marmoricola sp.]|jgi:predicted transcriptional regulator|nr:hypothetical protein [Marmoricola sp.]
MTTTIKVSTEVRDRLKRQANAAHRTLGEHLAHLAELGDRAQRFEALRRALDATPTEVLTSYQDEIAAWDAIERA